MSGRRRDGVDAGRPDALRRRIAVEAARGVAAGSDVKRAVLRAARRVTGGWVPADQLPAADEVRTDLEQSLERGRNSGSGDRLDRIAALVGLLATVRRDPGDHPEGDALEHALQVFDLVRDERPYDEELLTAALVQEVGLVFDRDEPLAAGLDALGDVVTPRTRWLIESVAAARGYLAGTLGLRARHRLQAHPDFEAALLLAEADRRGRVRGGVAATLEQAVAILRELDRDEPECEPDGRGPRSGG